MKRRMLLFICVILLPVFSTIAENNIIVKSGDILLFNRKSSATVTFDYSKTEVNDVPLEEFLEEKEEDEYKEDWNRWIREAERMFIEDFNKKSKGLQLKRSKKTATDYNIVIKVKTIDTGNTAQGFLPSFSLKIRNGASAMNGILVVENQEGKRICTLILKNLYGVSGLNGSTRLTTLYMELSKKIRKAVDYAAKENLKQQMKQMIGQGNVDKDDDDDEEADEKEVDEEDKREKNDNKDTTEKEETNDEEEEDDVDNEDDDDDDE